MPEKMKQELLSKASDYFEKRPVTKAIFVVVVIGVIANVIKNGRFSLSDLVIWILVSTYLIWGYSHELKLRKK